MRKRKMVLGILVRAREVLKREVEATVEIQASLIVKLRLPFACIEI